MEKFIVLFVSINSDDELWQEVIGVFDTEEEAHNAMKEDINDYLGENGETIEEWKIKATSATYKPPFSSVQKQYKIVKQKWTKLYTLYIRYANRGKEEISTH